MSRRKWLALIGFTLVGFILFLAAAYADEAKPQTQPECMSTEELVLSSMAQNGVAPKVALTGDAVTPFKQFVEEARGSPLGPKTAAANHVLIFKNGDKALVVWFHDTCMIGYGIGPWEPLAQFLGIPPDKAV